MPIGFAHRGARLEHPDNTLAGFSRALELGASALETDAWVTSDGRAVLDHDGLVGRVPRRHPIGRVPRSALPDRIPDIGELYELCGAAVDLSVDVKVSGVAPLLIAAGRAAGAADRLWLCSPDAAALAAWRSLDPDVHLVHSTSLAAIAGARHPYRLAADVLSDRVRTHVRGLRRAGIATVNLHHQAWSPATVAMVREEGARAFAWDAQRRVDLERCCELGVDGVYSDDVALMVGVLQEAE